MIGCGTVGGGVAQLLHQQRDLYRARLGKTLELRRVLIRNSNKPRCAEIDPGIITTDAEAFFTTPGLDIFVEVAGGEGGISQYVRRVLEMGKHVVTANKSLLAKHGSELFALARQNKAAIGFEASCAGGIPIITALQFGLMANRIDALYGILNGTSNYILTEMTQRGKTYVQALREAQQRGFAEADPTLDVSGKDAAQKLAILASLAFGVRADDSLVWCEGIDTLRLEDIRFAAELGYDIKLLGIAERKAGQDQPLSLRVHPCFVHKTTQLAQVQGPFNALSIYGHATGHTMYYGRGAGQLPTASAVVSDLLNIASGWYPHAFAAMNLWCDTHQPPQLLDPDELVSRYFLRISAKDVPGTMAKVSVILGESGISLGALLQHEVRVGDFVPVVIITHSARQGSVMRALKQIERLDIIQGKPVCIRIVDLPEG